MKDAAGRATELLGNLHALEAKTNSAERKILESAEARLRAVRERMDELRPNVLVDRVAAQTYQDCVREVGHLQQVIARSRERVRS